MRIPGTGARTVTGGVLLALMLLAGAAAGQSCPPEGWSHDALLALKADRWRLADSKQRDALALSLPNCLSSPDPVLRDRIAFEGLSVWMRGEQLAATTLQQLVRTLQPKLAPDQPDPAGFTRPFAALTLAELARADRLKPFLGNNERARLIDAAVAYLTGVRDYRGFDAREGWRHGVAHGADLLLQLAANTTLGRAEHERILGAIAAQVAPPGDHFYIYGEGERLARPVLLVARRGTLDTPAWNAWIKQVATPAPFKDWDSALQTQAGLARRHNLAEFLLVLYTSLREGQDDNARQLLLPAVTDAVRSLP